MTPSARIQSLVDFLEMLEDSPKPADSLLSSAFRLRRFIGSKDRADIAERYYRILRFHARFKWWAKYCKTEFTPRFQAILDILFHDKMIYEARQNGKPLNEMMQRFFDGQYHGALTLTGEEHDAIRRIRKQGVTHLNMPDDVRLECPKWIAPRLKEVLGDQFEAVMSEMLEPARLHVRVNTLKATRDETIKALRRADIHATAGTLSPQSLIIQGRPALSASEPFKNGWVEIQDEGSQLIGFLSGAKPKMRVSDFCSGAGGKALAMASTMKNKGTLIASDVLAGKLKRARVRFTRAGIDCIEARPLTTENDKWVKRAKGTFDVVLTDAPCSGVGTWKRNPDMRWRFKGPDLEELLVLQESIIDSASRLVKIGGEFIYATCSLLPEENANQVDKFLAKNDNFELVPVKDIWEDRIGTPNLGFDKYLDLTPAHAQTDGFFAAVMRRVS